MSKKDKRYGRGHRKSEPSGKTAGKAAARQSNRKPDLAACRSRKKLAKRDEIGECAFIEPSPPHHEFVAKISEMRDRPAERGQTEA